METEFSRRELQRAQKIRLWSFLAVLIGLFLIIVLVENLLVSSVMAFVFSYLASPIVNGFERTGISRLNAILLTFFLIGLLVYGTAYFSQEFLITQIDTLKTQIPDYIEQTAQLMRRIESRSIANFGVLQKLNFSTRIESFLSIKTQHFFEALPIYLSKILSIAVLTPFIAFFLLKDGRKFSRSLFKIVPNQVFELTLNLYHQINAQMGQFIRARILEAAIVGTVVWLGLWAYGFPYAFLFALFAALTNLIPYVGPIIGAIPVGVLAIINGETPLGLLAIASIYMVAQLIDIIFIIPLVVAKIVDLHPITVVVAIIIGAQLLGTLGMLISIPVASALKVTISSIYNHVVDFRG